jgi:phosphoribosylglycinamide formyltransferase-1
VSALQIAVLASGEGTNLQALIDGPASQGLIRIVGVASDKPDAPALVRAQQAGIPTGTFPADEYADRTARDLALADWLESQQAELVVSAGYMQLLDPGFIERFRNRIVNVHPSLLPRFPGMDAIGQALDAGVSETGATVHFVDEGVDTGALIASSTVLVPEGASREELEALVHEAEHQLLPEVIAKIAGGVIPIGEGSE